jgi:competence protein ComEC
MVASLLLAQRDGLEPAVRERYARAGLSHLLAISGLHVGLVAGILLLLGGATRTGRRGAAAIAAVGTVAYVALLGAPHSAARAALQIVLVLAARAVQRPARTEALMATAALVLLAVEPAALAGPGFQLSFGGVAGILVLRRPLLRRLGGEGKGKARRWLADGVATSVAATAATAPIVAWHFGRVAPIGVVANLVAIPLLGAAVPSLATALAAGWVWLPAGRFLAGGGELLLDLLDRTAAAAAAVPWGTVAVLPRSALVLTGALGAGLALARRSGRLRPAVRAGLVGAVATAVLAVAPLRPAGDRVEVHVIDVGQGDAIALRSPANRWLLVDAGVARADYDAGARRVVPYLVGRGVTRLEGLIISHPDADHMGGAGAVMEALRPRWVGGPVVAAGKPGYLSLLERARAAGVPWVAAVRGLELELDGMTVTALYPDRAGLTVDDANDASVVLRVEYGAFAALLTGDAPAAVEDRLVRRFGRHLDADVLKVGHHGSTTSTSPELLDATSARTALISAGRGNRYGHPHGTILARLQAAGVSVYRTDRHGAIVVRGRGDGRVWIRTEKGGVAR